MSSDNNNNNKEMEPFLYIAGQPIYFQEDWGTGIGGGLWSTGAALAKYFDTAHAAQQIVQQQQQQQQLQATSFLELGSGNGLLSVCWMALLASSLNDKNNNNNAASYRQHKVAVTDTEEHLALIRQTIDANPHIIGQRNIGQPFQVMVQEHLWGELDDESNVQPDATKLPTNQTFDYIVGSDVAYRRELYEPLIASLQRFAHDRTVILLGCTMADTTPKFFDLLQRAGFLYRRLADHVLPAAYRGQQTFGIFLVQRRRRQQQQQRDLSCM